MAQKRRIAIAVDPEYDVVTLEMLRSLVDAADAQAFRYDSTFEIHRDEVFHRTYLALNEVTP